MGWLRFYRNSNNIGIKVYWPFTVGSSYIGVVFVVGSTALFIYFLANPTNSITIWFIKSVVFLFLGTIWISVQNGTRTYRDSKCICKLGWNIYYVTIQLMTSCCNIYWSLKQSLIFSEDCDILYGIGKQNRPVRLTFYYQYLYTMLHPIYRYCRIRRYDIKNDVGARNAYVVYKCDG